MNKVIFDSKEVIPSKIVCVGMNYVEHIKELYNEFPDEPVLFIKPNSSISNDVFLPPGPSRYEGEICFIIKEGNFAGVAFGLDLTLSEIQKKAKTKGYPWEKCKAFDRSAVFSEFVSFRGDLLLLNIEFYVNEELKQKSSVELMIYKPRVILEEIKKFFTLEDYDIIMTGTPSGVGPFNTGDRFSGKIIYDNKILTHKEWTVKGELL